MAGNSDLKNSLTVKVGAVCCAALLTTVPKLEGSILRGYSDPIGIVTACSGHTKSVVLGHPYTPDQCEQFLIEDLSRFADVVDRCAPGVPMTPYVRAAMISFAFNVGPGKQGVKDGFCVLRSGREPSLLTKLKVRDYTGACNGLLAWDTAGGKVMQGIANRRRIEADLCLGNIK